MRAFDEDLKAHLLSGATTLATCWRIERRDGEVFAFTDHDRALSFDGDVYGPQTGGEGSALSSSADLSIDNAEVVGLLSSERLSPSELMSGRFDGAEVQILRVNWAAPTQRFLMKRGLIGEVKREGASFTAEIRGLAQSLDQPRGRVYERVCDALVGDARCGVDLDGAAFKGEGVVTSVIDDGRFIASELDAFDDGWFVHGRLDWLTGENAGTSGHVKTHAGGALSLWLPAGASIAEGDAFEVRAGCDKAFATCRAKFSNAINFRGFHMMPGNDFIIQVASADGDNDGGKRG
ncbi:MAG: DUF2163 domain-containing protein [Caulobacterales bacterium]|nr:DUF2163 domain-containing protein [Caulobacterales bacterium]